MGGDMEAMKDNPAVRWVFDHPEYEFTGIRYYGQYKPARLEVTPLLGPAEEIAPGESFTSCRAFECSAMRQTRKDEDLPSVDSGA